MVRCCNSLASCNHIQPAWVYHMSNKAAFAVGMPRALKKDKLHAFYAGLESLKDKLPRGSRMCHQ